MKNQIYAKHRMLDLSHFILALLFAVLPQFAIAQELPSLPCDRDGSLRSLEANAPTTVTFINQTNATLKVNWLDYNGQRVPSYSLSPGQTLQQATYVTHPWVVTTPQDEVVGIYLPSTVPSKAVLRRSGCNAAEESGASIALEDLFGRDLSQGEVLLTDWEGFLANPAIKLSVKSSPNTAYPLNLALTCNAVRSYMNLPSYAGSNGAIKTLTLTQAGDPQPFFLSIFPDRDALDEDYVLDVRATDAQGRVSLQSFRVHVKDEDKASSDAFNIYVDFSKDATGFFNDPIRRSIVLQAAADWSFFIGDLALDAVAPSSEATWIWSADGLASGNFATNETAYKGFLLYAYGIHSELLRSGGEGSVQGGFQTTGHLALPLRRSGGIEIETAGNYNTDSWVFRTDDETWYTARYASDAPTDFYSVAYHEIGHALGFSEAYPRQEAARLGGGHDSADIRTYHSQPIPVGSDQHLTNALDDDSQWGAFGSPEYIGNMPLGPLMITKLSLLALENVGYPLRATSAFVPLSFPPSSLPTASLGRPYSADLSASGGLAPYEWSLLTGVLPPGLTLDSFTGRLSGVPTALGSYPVTLNVRDYHENQPGISQSMTLNVSLPEPVMGDWDGNDIVNAQDVTKWLRIFVGLDPVREEDLAHGDVRPKPGLNGQAYGDGRIGADDINWTLRRALGLEKAP